MRVMKGHQTMTTTYQLQLAVRDYECDMQGVVNNAVYQNYLEHARHEFLKLHGVDFSVLAKAGINLVVVRAELDYKGSLQSGDKFTISTALEQQSRLKFAFKQSITRDTDNKLMLEALVIGTGVNQQGKPYLPDQLLPLMKALTHQP
jgi:acyl-CoA thioester hydrolase